LLRSDTPKRAVNDRSRSGPPASRRSPATPLCRRRWSRLAGMPPERSLIRAEPAGGTSCCRSPYPRASRSRQGAGLPLVGGTAAAPPCDVVAALHCNAGGQVECNRVTRSASPARICGRGGSAWRRSVATRLQLAMNAPAATALLSRSVQCFVHSQLSGSSFPVAGTQLLIDSDWHSYRG
jgi:hypothetical protein